MAKILHVLRRFVPDQWGGTETVVSHLCRQQQRSGHEVKILCTSALAQPGPDCVDGIPVVRFPFLYPFWPLTADDRRHLDGKGGNPLSFPLLRYLQTESLPDLIHLHAIGRIGAVVRHVSRHRDVPYVVSFHGGHFDVPAAEQELLRSTVRRKLDWGKPFGWLFGTRRVLADAAALLFVNPSDAERGLAALPSSRVLHLPNGVDLAQWANADSGPFLNRFSLAGTRIVLCVARIDPQKDQLTLVRAFGRVADSVARSHLVLIGPVSVPGYDAEIRREAERLGVANRVTLVPGLPVGSPLLPAAYAAAEFCVLPSRHEPFGITVLESWAARRPVIAAAAGGLVHLVQHGSNGLMFQPGDHGKLARRLNELFASSNLRCELAERGHETAARNYSWTAVADRHEAVYEEIWNGRRTACSSKSRIPWPCKEASRFAGNHSPLGRFMTKPSSR